MERIPRACLGRGCGGIWLDCGELARIRAAFPTEDERHKATRAYFDEVLGPDPAKAEVRGETKSSGRIGGLLRFFCPR